MAQSDPQPQPTFTHKQLKAMTKASRPWWKKKRIMLPLTGAVIIVGTQMAGGADDTTSAASAAPSSAAAAPAAGKAAPVAQTQTQAKVATIGQTVTEGDITFAINSWKCGARHVGPAEFGQKAQGEFCIADVVYTNKGNEPKTFDANMALTAYAGETKFKPDSGAGIYLNTESSTFLEQVNPGSAVKGKVAFDVAPGTKIDRVNIVDGFTGDGTPIKVG